MPRKPLSSPRLFECEIKVEDLLKSGLNLDLSDPNLTGTPRRISKMYIKEMFCNVGKEFKGYRLFPNDRGYDQMIAYPSIDFVSTCAHHFLPFIGKANLIYMPNRWLIGASKVTRLVHHYSKRPQLQEHLTHDIINSFWKSVKPSGVMVVLYAKHGCIQCRGVNQVNGGGMVTSAIKGNFDDPSIKQEALELIRLSKGE